MSSKKIVKKFWFRDLSSANSNLKLFQRYNGTYFLHDDGYNLNVLSSHGQLNQDLGFFLWLKIKDMEGDVWVTLIPRYSVLTKLGKNFLRLSIEKGLNKESDSLLYTWEDYGDDCTFKINNIIRSNTSNNMFNLQYNFDFNGKISVPYLLGFNKIENVNYLCGLVLSSYPNLENNDTNTSSINYAIPLSHHLQVIERACKHQALALGSSSEEVQYGIYVQPEGIDMDPQSAQALLIKYQSTKNEIYSLKKKFKKLTENLEQLKVGIADPMELEPEDRELENEEELNAAVNKIIDENALGPTIFISTNNYLKLILLFPCKNCGCHKINEKKWLVKSYGLYLNVTIYCLKCKFSSELCNESSDMNYSKAISATGLIAGLNQEELRTALPLWVLHHNHQELLTGNIKVKNEGKKSLCCGFDVSWTHVRNAYQASGELIFHGFVEGMSHKPVIAYSICEKPRIATKDVENDVLLEVAVDGDLDSNKT
ncbi:5429_t:CDS:2, partial [Entrophospora sp. SA101]